MNKKNSDNPIFFHIPFEYVETFSKYIIEKKMNLEIYFKADILDNSNDSDFKRISTILYENGIKTTFHAPFMDLSPGGIDKKIREISIFRIKQVLDAAAYFHPLSVVVHPGYDKWRFASAKEKWIEKSVETWEEILNSRPFDDITICLENVFEDNPSTIIEVCRKVQNENFRLCFDTGHFNLFSSISLEDWVNATLPYLKEMHLHDNCGKSDDHDAIGNGNVNFMTLFKLTKKIENPILTIEAHSPENVFKSIERLGNILKETNFFS
ncbi:MAG: hypothetical protein D6734_06420 [Candidatus Schekmanbacteria bacterium]|nr:MAG: hypothetical protein D6734_06420 [Candidatus Schekmanbacteria bacterium]